MNQTFQSIRVGIFFVLGVILIYAVYTVIGSGAIKSDTGYTITAEFDNIRTLTPGSDVRMAGVFIGQVTSTELADGRGLVTLRVDPEVQIPADSVASIAMSSLLGQNYVSVDYGADSALLSGGDQILTDEGADFNEILGEVKKLGERLNSMAESFSGLEGGGMGELFTNLNELVTDNRNRFDTVMVNLEELTTKLNSSEGTLGKLINEDGMYTELMSVVDDFRSASADMKDTLASAKDLFAKVEAGEGTLGRLLVDDTIAVELEATIANMKSFSEKLNSGEGTLGKLVTDDSLYVELRGMLNKADQALDSLGDSGPITAAGAVSGALF
ncbi:MCE family protein [Puniceicoccales bacterium CK1056]|uniref:MCE family protein n=1 Tax=Oceanipulchritudo coccoides TaxID=2706888 RepID=A0A6B2LXV8_9BACT|nr:MlaD family protein [Oceanipulchritudo coccoides]NDV60849.1 MCE family protein [Oceanipulchritudo coccoides]